MKKRKVRITNTGYLPDSPDRNNPMNIIPSNQITMKKVPFPILGIDNMGNRQMMMPGGEYSFPGQYVTEIPMGKYQKGKEVTSDQLDLALDAASFIPGYVGMGASAIGAVKNLAEGDYTGVALDGLNIITLGASKWFKLAEGAAKAAGKGRLAKSAADKARLLEIASNPLVPKTLGLGRDVYNYPWNRSNPQYGKGDDNFAVPESTNRNPVIREPLLKNKYQQGGGIYMGDYEFKDGGLVKYQDKGEVNTYELERRAKAMGHNSIEDYRNANWGYGENHPKIVKLRQEYPYTWKLAKGLPSVERYKNVSPTQWFDMLDMIAQAESKNKNIRQGNNGPGRGYYQFEAPSTTTAKNRAIQIKKDLNSLGYDLQVPERFDTNFMNLSKDEQAFYTLSNLIKGASAKREGNPNYKIDLTNPGKAWFDLHWAGAEKHPEDVNDRIAHWNESNPNYKIAFDKNGELLPIKGYGGLIKAQKGKEYKTPTGQSIYLDPDFKTYARYKDENGNVIPTTELQKFSMIYDPQANTWDSTHSETPLQVNERRLNTEDRVNKWLGNPMDKAVKVAEGLTEAGEDPIDNIRHPLAGLYTAQAIAKKTGNIPYISPALGWLGSNVMGIGHELGTIMQDGRPLKQKGREALEDIFNNNAGATMSLMPIPDAAKEEVLFQMSFNNKLPDGIVHPEGRDFYFKKDGGSVRKVKIKRAPRKNQ